MPDPSEPVDLSRRLLCAGGLAFAAAQLSGCDTNEENVVSGTSIKLSNQGRLASFDGASGWLNSPPLTPAGLKGKVVLVDFWTYTCINWIRTLPYIRAWHEKYRDHGLVVIGVHTPEFQFEKDVGNVRWATRAMRIDYPVALDPDYAVWHAFANHYWPAAYLADANGQLRYHQFGEGGYAEFERVIQQLLRDAGQSEIPDGLVSGAATGVELAADWDELRSGETYVGYLQGLGLASAEPVAADKSRAYTLPSQLGLNAWALGGEWTIRSSGMRADAVGAKLTYRFRARDLNLVMGPPEKGTTVRFRVTVDGVASTALQGIDVDAMGNGTVVEQRLYQLVRQSAGVEERTFEIEFLDAGAEVYVFTFG
jgi:thiol-disulfide isomerase/thioredoxin